MIIQHNMLANYTNRQLGINNKSISKNTERLASGYRINRAADDAAGLAISEKMRGQIRGLQRAAQNAEEGMNFCQVADGAMQELESIIQRIRELSVQSANDTYIEPDRETIQEEVGYLIEEIDRITDDTEFNTIKVFKKNRVKTEYEEITGSKLVQVGNPSGIEIEGKNYGITEVLGADHVYQGKYMDSPVDFLGTGWNNTGVDTDTKLTNFGSGLGSISSLQNLYGINIPVKSSSNRNVTMASSDNKSEIILKYSGIINGNYTGGRNEKGEYLITGIEIKTYDKELSDQSKQLVNSKNLVNTCGYLALGTKGAGNSTQYYGAWLDFSGLGKDYDLESLDKQGFNTGCMHCNGSKRYNIRFTTDNCSKTNADGINYNYEVNGKIHTIILNINGCKDGSELVKRMMSVANSERDFTSHYIQMAYNDNEPVKLYMYDSLSDSKGSQFEPVTREDPNVNNSLLTTWVRVPIISKVYKYEDAERVLQVGSNTNQIVALEQPWIDTSRLGLSMLDVTTQEGAEASIQMNDYAIEILNNERSKMGALYNRLEHIYANDMSGRENLQTSESLIRDADLADEMVQYSSRNIIQQAAQSVLAQSNSMPEGLLALIS